MKKTLLFILSSFSFSPLLFSQGFAGINIGNYAGITGVMIQPASIVDSRFKFDINLFSTDVRYSNNYFLLNRNVLLKFNKNNFDDYPSFRSKYLSEAKLAAGEKAFFNVSNRTQLPASFMLTLNGQSAIAFNLQSRSMLQGRNISQDLAKVAFNSFYHQPLTNQAIDASALTLRSLSWVEAGLTYGRVLLKSGNHFLKGAATVKYLGGVSSLNLASNNLTLRVNNDSTFDFTTDRVNYDHNKNADFNRVIDSRFRPDANALGFDAGLVYEYRGRLNNIKYIRNDDEESYEVKRRDLNKYIFRLGVSILDAGMFRFTKADQVNSFRANITNWDIRNSRYSSINEFDTALANRVTPLANNYPEYNMYLPGALSVQLDIRFVKGLYLNAMAYRPFKMGSEAGTRFNNYGYYSITPRYERRHFGIYIPYTFSDREDITNYRDNWLGLALKIGPVFFGSSNLGTMAFNQQLKAADFFVGLKIGFTYGKPSKITRLFGSRNQTEYDDLPTEKENRNREKLAKGQARSLASNQNQKNKDTAAVNKLIVDYSKGQIYTDGKTAPVIIVNNHYYYGNAAANSKDSFYYNRDATFNLAQQNANSVDSAAKTNLAQKKRIDSVNRTLNDSLMQKREQLDSLINRLYNLRQKLDSAGKEGNSSEYNNQRNSDTSSLQNTTAIKEISDDTVPGRSDSLRRATSSKDSIALSTGQATKNEVAKKKVTAPIDAPIQQGKPDSGRLRSAATDSAARLSGNNRIPQQQTLRDETLEDYLRQTERLQTDVERLQRQVAYNRTTATYVAPQPNFNPSIYDNTALPPSTGSYPVGPPAGMQARRDTIYIRDTVFLVKRDTITKVVSSGPTKDVEIVTKEKVNYKKLPAENILFATGEAVIRRVYVEKITYLADILRQNPELMISITGHTDKTGLRAANSILSLKRANAVKAFFVQKGIKESQMQLAAVAAENPLVSGDTKNAKTQNRRVEIKILE